jgi:hypothetical protein
VELTAGSSLSGEGGMAVFIAGSSSSGAGGSLLWNPEKGSMWCIYIPSLSINYQYNNQSEVMHDPR